MGKVQGRRKSAQHQRRARPRSTKAGSPRPRSADPSLGFPTIPLDDLVRQQGVMPIDNLEGFASLWPAEFDPDEFVTWLAAERKAGRQLASATRRGPH